ncbi:glutathione peroxidase [Nocardioides yefusunii]|uniref:Glutathione peroxidase n=1 Tax=Nocardioides yefusunii TaxID=2500546 RepID=A0ABW1QZ11_9ACTN|nr:glutathione peroxidase [Nocardioides yefusunii]
MTTVFDFTATAINGTPTDLGDHRGKVLLVVNTASQCGFTPQFTGLQQLQDDYAERGFSVLGFPCDQFRHQDPGTDEEIAEFCTGHFGVTFPMFSKVDVNGENAHPIYQWLREQKSGVLGNKIKWNFTKFLIGKDGAVIKRYAPTTKPEAIAADVEAALNA